ncbi:MAG TPA: hypothetical protein DIC23_06120 [Planctomycetaceae bacterium]|nr:hypothetical protein [Planctomycetaceae bacterium]
MPLSRFVAAPAGAHGAVDPNRNQNGYTWWATDRQRTGAAVGSSGMPTRRKTTITNGMTETSSAETKRNDQTLHRVA